MWSDNPTSVYVVTAIGAFLGRTCNAAAGFGAGIMVVCVWVIFECAGVYPGLLQQAIVCSSVSSAVMVPMMLYVTKACSTADLRLVATILATTAMSAPVGAAILLRLNRHQVQIFMGCAVLGFILMEQSATWFLSLTSNSLTTARPAWATLQQFCSLEFTKRSKSDFTGPDVQSSTLSQQSSDVHHKTDELQPGTAAEGVVVVFGSNSVTTLTTAGPDPLHQRLPVGQQAAAAHKSSSGDGTDTVVHLGRTRSNSLNSSSKWSDLSVLDLFGCCKGRKMISSSQQSTGKLVGYGFVAASISGLMSALTGVGGPPLMIMYRALDTPKDIVRGTNAFIEMFAVRLITYYYMGLLKPADAQLYLVACSASSIGVIVGNRISGRLNQLAFRRVLLVLMVVCSGLMFISGFGLLNDR